MNIIEVTELSPGQKEEIYSLWNDAYPERLNYRNPDGLEDYLDTVHQKLHLLLLDEQQHIEGWFFLFERAGDNWFAMILSDKARGKGYGTRLLNEIKTKTAVLNAWVIDHDNDRRMDGAVYPSPVGFYLKNGFTVYPEERFESLKMSAVKMQWRS